MVSQQGVGGGVNLNVSAPQSHLRRIRFDEEWDGLRNFGVFRLSVVRRFRMCG